MRRTLPGIAGTAALALVLAACGGSSESDSNADSNTSSNETDPASLDAELTWWDTSDPTNEAPAYDDLIKKFNEEYPNVTIKHETVPFDQTQNKFKTAADSGSGAPDILRAEVAWTPEFAALGYLYALDGTAALEDNNFQETPLSSNVYDGSTYGVPQVTDTLGLMYNKELFEKAGLDPENPPTTWDEVATAAEALKSKADVGGIYLNSGGYFVLPFMYGEGADIVDSGVRDHHGQQPRGRQGHPGRPGHGEVRRRGQARRQRPVRHDDDPLQGGQGRHDHQRPVGGRRHRRRPEVRWHRQPRCRSRPGRLRRSGRPGRRPQLRRLLRHGRVQGRRRDRVHQRS